MGYSSKNESFRQNLERKIDVQGLQGLYFYSIYLLYSTILYLKGVKGYEKFNKVA